MTREKKEILKQLEAIDESARLECSIGEMSPKSIQALYDEVEAEREPLLQRLNELMHGKLFDPNGNPYTV